MLEYRQMSRPRDKFTLTLGFVCFSDSLGILCVHSPKVKHFD